MREPAFWHRRNAWQSLGLAPLAALYGCIAGRRMTRTGAKIGVPVICVGNFHVGGAGKTPTVLALVTLLRELGETPMVLSRGYGGKLAGPVQVDPIGHQASDVGDEPLMLAQQTPVIIAKDRKAGAAFARQNGASVIVMDDGFQNPAIAKDLSLIVVDSHRALGNGKVLPAGPLRAPLRLQTTSADGLIVVGSGNAAAGLADQFRAGGKPVFAAAIAARRDSLAALRGQRVLAFAGIGDPDKFYRTLRENEIDVAATEDFPDHHPYTAGDIARLTERSAREGLRLVTTQKDLIRLRTHPEAARIDALVVDLTFAEPADLRDLVVATLGAARR